MTSWRLIRALVGSTGWLWCIAGAGAQEPTVPARPADATIAASPSSFPWGDIVIQWNEPRYKIEAIHFKARDETGFDWPGSDEVMVETTDADGWTVTDEIGGIDSGDTHDFDPAKSCIVAVNPGIVVLGKTSVCHASGELAPLSFAVEIWEKGVFSFPSGFCIRPPRAATPGRIVGTTATATTSSAARRSTCRRRIWRPHCPGSAMNSSKPSC